MSSNNSNEFWNDELVLEFLTNNGMVTHDYMQKAIAQFKASKTPKREGGFEILGIDYSTINKYSEGCFSIKKLLEDGAKITKIMRKSDGLVFKIGDEIEYNAASGLFTNTIYGFDLDSAYSPNIRVWTNKNSSQGVSSGVIRHSPLPLKKVLDEKMPLKLTETDSKFLENTANVIEAMDSHWYYMPFWFRKVDEKIYIQYSFERLPEEVKRSIEKVRLNK